MFVLATARIQLCYNHPAFPSHTVFVLAPARCQLVHQPSRECWTYNEDMTSATPAANTTTNSSTEAVIASATTSISTSANPPAISLQTPANAAVASPTVSPITAATTKPSPLPTITLQRPDPPKNLRGLNKPKCIKCGNVARSRCPFQSCKSCCSKAQNPCHIHVLKANATLADRSPSSNNSTHSQQQSDVQASGPSNKTTSVRQLSNNFAQFNNVNVPRSRRPLTRKDATVINQWRFSKLKEYRDSNIEMENEAFDRYMQNISLLEEVFDVNSEERLTSNNTTTNSLSGMKLRVRSDPVKIDSFRKRIRDLVNQGLKKLDEYDLRGVSSDPTTDEDANNQQTLKMAKVWRNAKSLSLTDLNEKLNKARTEEDLNLCWKMMSSQVRSHGKEMISLEAGSLEKENLEEETDTMEIDEKSSSVMGKEFDSSLLKLVRKTEIDQESLKSMDSHFSSLEEIEDL